MGANGTGKTSFLWGLIVALRSFNLRASTSQKTQLQEVGIEGEDFAVLINCPLYKGSSWKSIAHNSSPDDPAQIDVTIQQLPISWRIKGNGVITLLSDEPARSVPKVRFAFMSESVFVSHSGVGEPAVGDILTSGAQNMRGRLRALDKAFQERVEKNLIDLFAIDGMSIGEREIDIKEGTSTTEIMFTGEAFRKVFSALVLLYTLASTPEKHRVFIIEEPEAHLYPTIQESFIQLLTSLADEYKVQLFLTTNSQNVLSRLNVDDVVVLERKEEGTTATRIVSSDDELLANAIRLPLLALHPAKPLILTEGDQDEPFIRKMAELCKISTEGVQFFTGAKFKDASHMKPLIDSIHRIHPGVKIRLIRDRDFIILSDELLRKKDEMEFSVKGKNTAEVVYWDLPTIESYLFLQWCQRTSDPFAFLRKPGVCAKFMSKFFYCWRMQNEQRKARTQKAKENEKEIDACQRWLDASTLFTEASPSLEQRIKVARVLHGHTWVSEISSSNKQLLRETVELAYAPLEGILKSLLVFD